MPTVRRLPLIFTLVVFFFTVATVFATTLSKLAFAPSGWRRFSGTLKSSDDDKTLSSFTVWNVALIAWWTGRLQPTGPACELGPGGSASRRIARPVPRL